VLLFKHVLLFRLQYVLILCLEDLIQNVLKFYFILFIYLYLAIMMTNTVTLALLAQNAYKLFYI